MRKVLFISCLLILSHTVISQCPVDAVLALDTNCIGTAGGANSGDPTGNDPIDDNPCSINYAGGDDYIFTYTATTTDALQLDLEGTNAWSGIMVTDDCPDESAANCIGFSTSSSNIESLATDALVPGTTYYIHISTWPTPQSIGQFCLNASLITPPTPPENDECADAISLTVNPEGEECITTTPGTINFATPSPEDDTACDGTENDDVWFSFVATRTEHFIDLLNISGSTTNLYHSVWEGPCGANATNLLCSDEDASTVTGLTVGTTYYLRVNTWSEAINANANFEVCITTPPPIPENDLICDAITLACDTGMEGTTLAASGGLEISCLGSQGDNVWYEVIGNGDVMEITVDVSTAGEAAQIDIYTSNTNCNGSLNCVLGIGAGSNPITASLESDAGTTYYIAVGNWINDGAPFDFNIDLACPACPDPTDLSVGNETDNSVLVTWTSFPAFTSIVEVCPSGITPGDATCTIVVPATSPLLVTGLTECTDYDAYVYGECEEDVFSGFVGPLGFSTVGPDSDLMPSCGSTISYPTCTGETYEPNENITWTLCPEPGMTAEIEFTYVDIETDGTACFDNLAISYSDGSSEPSQCGEPDGDGGIGTGLSPGSVFTNPVPDGCITVTFSSDETIQESGFSFDFNCVCDNVIGQACDDGDDCTENDIINEDCACVGVFMDSDNDGVCDDQDQCPGEDDSIIGATCDDGDPCTINDVYTSACNCEGVETSDETVELSAEDDAYLQGGSRFNVNILRVENPNRVSYLKFDLSSISAPIVDIVLELTTESDAGSGTVEIYKSDDVNWTENDLNTNNAPGQDLLVGNLSGTFSIGTTYSTSLSGINNTGLFSIILVHQAGGNDVAFASDEYATVSSRPRLVVTTAGSNCDLDYSITMNTNQINTTGNDAASVVLTLQQLSGELDAEVNTVYLNKDPKIVLSYDPLVTAVNGVPVENSAWSFDDSDPNFYIWTRAGNLNLMTDYSFSYDLNITPSAQDGILNQTIYLKLKPEETDILNNTSNVKIFYTH